MKKPVFKLSVSVAAIGMMSAVCLHADETKTTNYQLDVIIKMVDLVRQSTVYSNVYTGNYRELRPVGSTQIDQCFPDVDDVRS